MSTVLTVALFVGAIVLSLLIAIGVTLVTTEARGSIPGICDRLLDRTATRLPNEMRDRREEWAAELYDAKDRPIAQMAIAVRIWRDGRALAGEASAGVAEDDSPAAQISTGARLVELLCQISPSVYGGRPFPRPPYRSARE